MKEEIKFDHFKDIEELLEHIKMWYAEDDVYYTRWFGLNDLYKLGQYIDNLKQENEELKGKIEAQDKIINNYAEKEKERFETEMLDYLIEDEKRFDDYE